MGPAVDFKFDDILVVFIIIECRHPAIREKGPQYDDTLLAKAAFDPGKDDTGDKQGDRIDD